MDFFSLGSVHAVASAAFSSFLKVPLPFFLPILWDAYVTSDTGVMGVRARAGGGGYVNVLGCLSMS